MNILGFLGSPRPQGSCGKLLQKALEGAEAAGAHTKRYDLIKCNIKYCRGCGNCYMHDPQLAIGKCPLKDDVATILDDYVKADGYVYATPVYDMFVTALMKTFLERKIALTYKPKDAIGKLPEPRPGVAKNFMNKASIIVTGNCGDELVEVMGDPCFEAFDGHFMIQQVDSVDRFYVGGLENMSAEAFADRLQKAYQLGFRLVEEIKKARAAG
jgi:multimeric flavodoxin WrbA